MQAILIALSLAVGGEPVVNKAAEPTTRVYVRTIPAGAQIKLDDKPQGKSDALFVVPPGVQKMTIEVELDGHYPRRKEIEIRGGRITRVELVMEKRPEEPAKPDAGVSKGIGSQRTARLDFRVAPVAVTPGAQPRTSKAELVVTPDSANWPLYDKPLPGAAAADRFAYFPCPASLDLPPDLVKFRGWPGVPLPDSQGRVLLCNHPEHVMLESDAGDRRWGIKQVTVVTQEGRYTIHIELDAAGARRMEWLSATHVGMSLAILVNDTVVSMPVIRGITGSHVELTGDFTEEEALRLADALRAGIHEPATAKPATAGAPIVLGHVRDSTEKRLSYADAGHAVLFDRPQGAKSVTAVRLFCSRYGPPQPPEEDLHIYILDRNQKVIRDVPVPYAKIERGDMRWYTFEVPPTLVPERFYVAAAFNAHQTKGVYLGMDDSVKESHSYAGLPESGFKKLDEKADWMIRVLMGPK